MRQAKLNRQRGKKVKQHTKAERLELRREKKRSGPCAQRRRERRKPLHDAEQQDSERLKEEARLKAIEEAAVPELEHFPSEEPVGTPVLAPVYALLGELKKEFSDGN